MIALTLPQSLKTTPRLDRWVRFNADRTVTVFSGKVELGQGIETAIAQIAADELDVALERLSLVAGDTTQSPDEWYTAGSQSIEIGGMSMRLACAEVRSLFWRPPRANSKSASQSCACATERSKWPGPTCARATGISHRA